MCSIKKARIAYAGPALTDGEMDVRELARHLLLLQNLFQMLARQ